MNIHSSYYFTSWKTHNRKNSPWCNDFLKKLLRRKHKLWKKYRIHGSEDHYRQYMKFSKFASKKVNKAREQYERRKFNSIDIKATDFYKYIENRTKIKSNVSTLLVHGSELGDDYAKCAALSDQYRSVFTVDDGRMPEFERKMPMNSLVDIAVNDRSLIEAIHKMNASSAAGPDNISPLLIKKVYPFLIKPLKIISEDSPLQ